MKREILLLFLAVGLSFAGCATYVREEGGTTTGYATIYGAVGPNWDARAPGKYHP